MYMVTDVQISLFKKSNPLSVFIPLDIEDHQFPTQGGEKV